MQRILLHCVSNHTLASGLDSKEKGEAEIYQDFVKRKGERYATI
jgi:hypothetical protein